MEASRAQCLQESRVPAWETGLGLRGPTDSTGYQSRTKAQFVHDLADHGGHVVENWWRIFGFGAIVETFW